MSLKGKSIPVERAYRILITCAYFEPGFRGGGPVRSVARLVDTSPDGAELLVITQDRDLGSREAYAGLSGRYEPRGTAHVFYLSEFAPRQWLRLVRDLRANPPDLLYLNSLWDPRFTILPIVLSKLHVFRVGQILLAPRGELSPGALLLKARKKRLVLRIWRPLLVRSNMTWHASSELEREDVLRTFPDATIVVSSDQGGRPMHPIAPSEPSRALMKLIFLGRVSPKKNILMTLDAMHLARLPMSLDIFGPIEDRAYWERCENSMATLPPGVTATYRGELRPELVCATFSLYDAFVFPTLGENFGHVIAESLSASCPVICSRFTPWNSVLGSGGGQVLESVDSVALGGVLNRWAMLGSGERTEARVAAGEAYRVWRSHQTPKPHLFQPFMTAAKCSGTAVAADA